MIPTIQTASLADQIENALKQQILSGELSPGQKISVEELASQWGVSNTPIRDALKHLEVVGLVKFVPRRGVYVGRLDRKSFKNIFDLRIALECLAIETATDLIPDKELKQMLSVYHEAEHRLHEEGDREFMVKYDHVLHDAIIAHCDNRKLVEFMGNLKDLDIWARATLLTLEPKAFEAALPEHLAIVYALCERDSQTAQKLLKKHLQSAFHRAYDQWNSNGDAST